MKFKVSYYDYDTDSQVTKKCHDFKYRSNDTHDVFDFTPVDEPVKIYKTVTIDRPHVTIAYTDSYKFKIIINGYQYMDGGYWTTTTTIESVED